MSQATLPQGTEYIESLRVNLTKRQRDHFNHFLLGWLACSVTPEELTQAATAALASAQKLVKDDSR